MESNSRNLRDIENITLDDSITSIDCSVDYMAAGCLSDTLYVWYLSIHQGKKTSATSKKNLISPATATQWASSTSPSTKSPPS